MVVAADNAYGLGIAVFGFLGLGISAWFSFRAARNASATRQEVASPNGTKTGEAIYQLAKDVLDVRQRQIEQHELGLAARAAQGEILSTVQEHNAKDDQRFAVLFEQAGISDPTQ